MEWKPDKVNDLPLYKQISNYLESCILNGEWPSGSRLPSERNLAKTFRVNRSTINSAFEELKSSGLVQSIVGVGTVVSKNVWENDQNRTPNWDRFVKEGFYLSNNPINQMIYQLIQTEEKIINFGIGELHADLLPMKLMENVHRSMKLDGDLGYQHIQGNIKLREVISTHMKQYRNITASASSILITSGAQQAIHLIIQCLLCPGDSVANENPSYAYSLPIFHSDGLNTHFLDVQDEGIDPEQIIDLYKKHRIKMIFLNPIHQNPTGTTLNLERRKKVMEICNKYGIAIIEDDPYSLLTYDDEKMYSLKSMDTNGLVLYISSLSKIISSGLRIGWISGPQPVIQRLADVKQQIDFGHSNFSQWYATALLESPYFNEHIIELRRGLKNKRDLIVEAFKHELHQDIRFIVPNGGIHLWCESNHKTINDQLLFNDAIKRGVIFAPGNTLGSQHNFFRFTYSRPEMNTIANGIHRFAEALKASIKK
ncbi:PLP-dependent aminotransferase family protein [Halalkalibacter nanhaiisediminis]|uniref:DNA-binding transcriptional MocR family regulator n=1 Tax=Halalkalibacter nanhaiisediminis TaxID=688079 RepID=A0A562QSP2_9BACI|nr:PLP-dependent aminotransferase family protein [Halalkalibacter nanhaiisediminis]TWI59106.1 DNA-binding transcriptional MocR family regulator [Halalkalibacter nanhaiisediminis]